MDFDEFLTWAAFVSMHPFPEERADVHVGMLLAQTYNMNRGKGKPAKKPIFFIPEWFKTPRPRQTATEMKHVMQMHILAMGGDPESMA
jgi:hypothetical protein